MSVKGFKLNDGTVVKYDYSALDDITMDTTLTITGAVADAKATGDAISDAVDNMESKIGDLSDLTTTDKTSAIDAINELKTGIDDLSNNFSAGTWIPHIYDYETLVRSIGTGNYIKIGNMVFAWFNINNVNYSGISTMLQFRNLPLNMVVLGGTFYNANMTNSGGHETIQISETGVYLRPNITSSAWSNPTSTGWTTLSIYGYIPS